LDVPGREPTESDPTKVGDQSTLRDVGHNNIGRNNIGQGKDTTHRVGDPSNSFPRNTGQASAQMPVGNSHAFGTGSSDAYKSGLPTTGLPKTASAGRYDSILEARKKKIKKARAVLKATGTTRSGEGSGIAGGQGLGKTTKAN
jgi:hypothetical protein